MDKMSVALPCSSLLLRFNSWEQQFLKSSHRRPLILKSLLRYILGHNTRHGSILHRHYKYSLSEKYLKLLCRTASSLAKLVFLVFHIHSLWKQKLRPQSLKHVRHYWYKRCILLKQNIHKKLSHIKDRLLAEQCLCLWLARSISLMRSRNDITTHSSLDHFKWPN